MNNYLFLLCLAPAAYGSRDRIVGGGDAHEGQFPYQVSLRRRGRHFCGGSVIADAWILTAAHCVLGQKAEDFEAVAGTNLLDAGGVAHKIKQFVPHPSYDPSTISNDIALIRLEEGIETDENVRKIELATADTPEGAKLVLSGWGTTSQYPGSSPNKLQTVELVSIDNKKCGEAHPDAKIGSGNICTFTKAGEGACHGDSGGPLVATDHQVGIVSWGVPCAKGKPDVFTRVYSYLDWIKEHTG